ncbi:N-acetyltransferase [Pseudomonas fulva]|uniref:N-acetyltransferase n=1 Tax=Pseudomonas fulva TaxID=47880 RepID=UPI0015F719A8|nr:N-acetyltransferase [Pseudomonas fulva]MBA5706122.1 N-acetyltransferase [Pseudomonas fulva]
MLRPYVLPDTDAVLQIWLDASVQAHHFVPRAFWEGQLEAMRTVYLPASETFVFEQHATVEGFISLLGETVAALFVAPASQGMGIGSRLLDYAKQRSARLELKVYSANQSAVAFYQRSGFSIVAHGEDEHTGATELTLQWPAATS